MFSPKNYGAFIFKPIVALLALIITPPIFIFGFVASLLSLIVFGIYRRLIILIAKFKIPKGRILTKLDSGLALKEDYTSNHYYITNTNIFEGRLTLDRVQNDWKENVMNKLKKNGELQYPELWEGLSYFGGYTFRTPILNFDPNNYIHVYDDGKNGKEVVDKLKMMEIVKTFRGKVFSEGGPLWEFLIVNNYRPKNSENDPECSVFIVKISHVLVDGFSLVKLLWQNLAGISVELPKTDRPVMRTSFEILGIILLSPFVGFVIWYKMIFSLIYSPSKMLNLNDWHLCKKSKLPVKYVLWYSEPIHKNIFRQIKSQYNVTTMSVVINVITGGIKRMMLQKNLKVPKEMNVVFPIPLANHPDTLTNHAVTHFKLNDYKNPQLRYASTNISLLMYRSPIAITDIKKRIQTTDKRIKQAYILVSQTTLVNLWYYFTDVYPHWVKQFVMYDVFTSAGITCQPAPPEEVNCFGLTKVASFYDLTVTQTNAGVLAATLGSGDYFYMSLQIDGRLLSHPSEIRDLEKYILEELDFLGKNCLV